VGLTLLKQTLKQVAIHINNKNFSYKRTHIFESLNKIPLFLTFKRCIHWRKTFVVLLVEPEIVDVPPPEAFIKYADKEKDGIFIVDFVVAKRKPGITYTMLGGSSIWHDDEKCYGWF